MKLTFARCRLAGISILLAGSAPFAQAQAAAPAAGAPSALAALAAKPTDATYTPKPDDLKHYIITDYGAVADGTTLNTAAIQKAIDAAAAAGGGVLEVPKGTFLSGSLFFKPGVELFLDEGAVLLGSQNIADYPTKTTRIEGHFTEWPSAFINFNQMDHVRVGGTGQLNGNGAPYWAAFRGSPGAANLDVPRPRLMFVDRCKDVRIEGISFQDSGFWNLHLYDCSDVLIQFLRINAPGGSPSTDGIDVDSCQNVIINECQISNNDDDIALKGSKGPLADQDKDSPPDENILIENTRIGNGNGLLTCGSEATIVRDVLVRNCIIDGNAKMLTLKLRPDTPQHYSNITFDNITLNGSGSMIGVAPWTQYFDLQGHEPPTSSVNNITIRNITGNFGSFGSVRGNSDNPTRGTKADTLSDFTFENINVNLRNPAPLSHGEVANFVFKNVVVNGQPMETPPATTAPAGRGGRAGIGARGGQTGAPAASGTASGTAPPTP